MSRPSADEQRHWDRVAALGCIVTGAPNPTIHHCHSGSMAREGLLNRGSTRVNHYLVIPLDARLHSLDPLGIDAGMGVLSWEAQFGTQVEHLDEVSRRLGYNVWALAGIEREVRGVRASHPV